MTDPFELYSDANTDFCRREREKEKHNLSTGKLLREKTFTNFTVVWLFAKVFSVNFGGVVSFSTTKASNP